MGPYVESWLLALLLYFPLPLEKLNIFAFSHVQFLRSRHFSRGYSPIYHHLQDLWHLVQTEDRFFLGCLGVAFFWIGSNPISFFNHRACVCYFMTEKVYKYIPDFISSHTKCICRWVLAIMELTIVLF